MPLKSALLVSENEEFLNNIALILNDNGYAYIEKINNAAEALRRSQAASFDLCTINLQNCSQSIRLSGILSEQGIYVLIFCSRENFYFVENFMQKSCIIVIAKPVLRTELLKIIGFLSRLIAKDPPPAVKGETKELMQKAKSYMIEHFEMSEEHAHRFLQKVSMDNRMQLRDVCSMALDAFKL